MCHSLQDRHLPRHWKEVSPHSEHLKTVLVLLAAPAGIHRIYEQLSCGLARLSKGRTSVPVLARRLHLPDGDSR